MHTYRKSKDENLWTVGYFGPILVVREPMPREIPSTGWTPVKDFAREEDAADYCSYLNGGRRP